MAILTDILNYGVSSNNYYHYDNFYIFLKYNMGQVDCNCLED
jgi:hypothetical protein